jgi:predicted negative regulator of RcsB-dependent stress response
VAEKKPRRKELLKEPDEFITWSARAVAFTRNNPRTIGLTASLIVVVALASLAYYGYQNRRQSAAHEMLESAVRTYEILSVSENSKSSPEQDKVLAELDTISKNYGGLPSGEVAVLYEGHVLFNKGDYEGALKRYNQFQASALARKGLGPLAQYNIAETYMALKDSEKAISVFEQLSRDINSPYRREAYSSIARIYEMLDKKKEATQAYKQYLKIFPEAPDADFVKAKIAQLSIQG